MHIFWVDGYENLGYVSSWLISWTCKALSLGLTENYLPIAFMVGSFQSGLELARFKFLWHSSEILLLSKSNRKKVSSQVHAWHFSSLRHCSDDSFLCKSNGKLVFSYAQGLRFSSLQHCPETLLLCKSNGKVVLSQAQRWHPSSLQHWKPDYPESRCFNNRLMQKWQQAKQTHFLPMPYTGAYEPQEKFHKKWEKIFKWELTVHLIRIGWIVVSIKQILWRNVMFPTPIIIHLLMNINHYGKYPCVLCFLSKMSHFLILFFKKLYFPLKYWLFLITNTYVSFLRNQIVL